MNIRHLHMLTQALDRKLNLNYFQGWPLRKTEKNKINNGLVDSSRGWKVRAGGWGLMAFGIGGGHE